jgi:hypothetical protein
MFHSEFDYALGKERMVQMRKEVEHNHLEASLAKAASLSEEAVLRRDMVTRGITFVTALFR